MGRKRNGAVKVPSRLVRTVRSEKVKRLIGAVWGRIPAADQEIIAGRVVRVYGGVKADVEGLDGCMWPVETVVRDGLEVGSLRCCVWFDTASIEKMPEGVALATIAHELAHVFLGHSVYARALFVLAETEGLKVQAMRDVHEWDVCACLFLWGFAEELDESFRHRHQDPPPWWIKPENVHYYDEHGNEIERPAGGAEGSETPPGLAITGAIGTLRIRCNRPSEKDWAVTEFHVSTQQGFTPSAETLAQSGKVTAFTYTCSSYVKHYARARHGDTSENWSNYCDEVSGTPRKVDPPSDIPDRTIPGDKIINASIVNAHLVSCDWAKITDVVVKSGDIESLVCSKITTGSITAATITVSGGGQINIGDFSALKLGASPVYVYGDGNFARCMSAGGYKANLGYFSSGVGAGEDAHVNNGLVVSTGGADFKGGLGSSVGWLIVADGGGLQVDHDLNVDGEKNVIVQTSLGRRALSVIESPEIWFMDFVGPDSRLDPLFDEVIEGKEVLLVPCAVARRGPNGRLIETGEVRQQVFAKRKGHAQVRFGDPEERAYVDEGEVSDIFIEQIVWAEGEVYNHPEVPDMPARLVATYWLRRDDGRILAGTRQEEIIGVGGSLAGRAAGSSLGMAGLKELALGRVGPSRIVKRGKAEQFEPTELQRFVIQPEKRFMRAFAKLRGNPGKMNKGKNIRFTEQEWGQIEPTVQELQHRLRAKEGLE